MAKRASSFETGMASEFLVLSNLFRLGFDSFLSFGNKKAIDIIIKGKNGKTISIDVKSVRGYSSINVNNIKNSNNHFIIAVIFNNKFNDLNSLPDFYIIPSDKISILQKSFKKENRLMKSELIMYKDKWKQLNK